MAATAAESDVRKNVNCVELANRLGISSQAIRQFWSGRREPSLWRLHTIAEALGVRVR
ncbi:MAG: helix-turn-helix transcriptional regulator, partial [Prevotella sp.]|nr:helix-turn-helix transcriptional regulator [Prevotella sp.]